MGEVYANISNGMPRGIFEPPPGVAANNSGLNDDAAHPRINARQ